MMQIYNEDCLVTLSKMGNQSVDLVVTSPPYNMRTRVRNGEYAKREKGQHFSKKYEHFGDDLTIGEFYSLHKKVLSELIRVSRVVCYNIQIVTGSKEAFFKIIGEFSEYLKDIIVWDKGHGQPAMHDFVLNSCYELILIFESDKKKGRMIQNAKWERGKMNNIIRIKPSKSKTKGHGAVFPERLVSELILSFSSEGDLVYDPFGGTGTTAKVSQTLNRKWIISEISEEYCKIIKERIRPILIQKKLF